MAQDFVMERGAMHLTSFSLIEQPEELSIRALLVTAAGQGMPPDLHGYPPSAELLLTSQGRSTADFPHVFRSRSLRKSSFQVVERQPIRGRMELNTLPSRLAG